MVYKQARTLSIGEIRLVFITCFFVCLFFCFLVFYSSCLPTNAAYFDILPILRSGDHPVPPLSCAQGFMFPKAVLVTSSLFRPCAYIHPIHPITGGLVSAAHPSGWYVPGNSLAAVAPSLVSFWGPFTFTEVPISSSTYSYICIWEHNHEMRYAEYTQ